MNTIRRRAVTIMLKPHMSTTDGQVLRWKAVLIGAYAVPSRPLTAVRVDPCEAMVTVWAAYEVKMAHKIEEAT